MHEGHDLEGAVEVLRAGRSGLARHQAARELAEGGGDGARALQMIVGDSAVEEMSRIVALRHLSVDHLGQKAVEPLLRDLVEGASVALRIVALQKVAEFGLTSLSGLVERHCDSTEEIWDLDDCVVVGEVARKTLEALRDARGSAESGSS